MTASRWLPALAMALCTCGAWSTQHVLQGGQTATQGLLPVDRCLMSASQLRTYMKTLDLEILDLYRRHCCSYLTTYSFVYRILRTDGFLLPLTVLSQSILQSAVFGISFHSKGCERIQVTNCSRVRKFTPGSLLIIS